MRVLLTISILAFLALVWAAIAIVRHIHRARQRNRANAALHPAHPAKDLPRQP